MKTKIRIKRTLVTIPLPKEVNRQDFLFWAWNIPTVGVGHINVGNLRGYCSYMKKWTQKRRVPELLKTDPIYQFLNPILKKLKAAGSHNLARVAFVEPD